jgi:FixJ family two-component response regulator
MSAGGPDVAIVDDDASVRRGVARLLRLAGYSVRAFTSAREFLEQSQPSPACLVVDVRMPGQTGLDLQSALLAAGRDVPIVFITGHDDIPVAVRAMKAGAVDFLAKPFDEKDLLAAVAQAVSRRPSASTLPT